MYIAIWHYVIWKFENMFSYSHINYRNQIKCVEMSTDWWALTATQVYSSAIQIHYGWNQPSWSIRPSRANENSTTVNSPWLIHHSISLRGFSPLIATYCYISNHHFLEQMTMDQWWSLTLSISWRVTVLHRWWVSIAQWRVSYVTNINTCGAFTYTYCTAHGMPRSRLSTGLSEIMRTLLL